MNRREFERMVDEILSEVPPSISDRIDNLLVVVEDRPIGDQDPAGDGLLGLYEGVPLSERGGDYFAFAPDRILIFFQPHLDLGLDDAELRREIRVTVLHEIGHHIGIDDQRLSDLGWG
jgi:predicted Zn-dependent protease with MMP-like domain